MLLCAKWTLYWNLSNIACLEASTKISTCLNSLEPSFQSQRTVLLFNVHLHRIMLSNRIKGERWVPSVYTNQCMNKKLWKFEVVGIEIPKTAKILRVQQSPILKSPLSPWVILQKYKVFNWNYLQESVILSLIIIETYTLCGLCTRRKHIHLFFLWWKS